MPKDGGLQEREIPKYLPLPPHVYPTFYRLLPDFGLKLERSMGVPLVRLACVPTNISKNVRILIVVGSLGYIDVDRFFFNYPYHPEIRPYNLKVLQCHASAFSSRS